MGRTASITPESIEAGFGQRDLVMTGELATTPFLAEALRKPLLIEGLPAVGKTEIGKFWARVAELARHL